MKILQGRLGILAAAALSLVSSFLHAEVNVTTYHYDVARTGQNTQETILTPANVNASTFGKLFSVAVDGMVYAQPLYLSNVAIDGGTHNVVYVATEHDSLYAIDADNGTIYWQLSLIPAGGSTVNSSSVLDCGDLVPEVGITGTPVIDPSSGTIYLVAKSKVGSNVMQYLHAIDVVTSKEKFGGPIAIQASATGTATDAVGGLVKFSPQYENQRAGLLLDTDSQGTNHVVIGWSAHCDIAPWHGWIISYNAATLAQDGVFNASPNGYANGIWQSGSAPVADSSGNIYFATANGSWNGTTDFGDSIVKLGPPSGGTFPVLDYFTPYDQSHLSENDLDVSSGGLILLPKAANGKQQIVQQAKTGTIFNLDSSNLGKYCVNQTPACTNSDPQISQEIVNATVGIWGAPAYWNGSVYWAGGNQDTQQKDSIKAFAVNPATGLLSTTPTSKTAQTFGFSAPIPVVSSNGKTNGILWGLDNSQIGTCTVKTYCQVLYAYDATNLSTLLYSSQQAPNFRDVPAGAVKYSTPVVANGKVYVGSQSLLAVYGLLNATPAATPTFSPAAGSFTGAQSVKLTDATSGSTIYYTTNGTTPTTSSAIYKGAIAVSATTTIKALAVATGYTNSAIATATFTISAPPPPTVPTPTFSPASGAFNTAQSVTINDTLSATTTVKIYYTTNGTAPTTASTLYKGPIAVSGTTTINALAVATGYTNSAIATAIYTIGTAETPVDITLPSPTLYAIANPGTAVPGTGLDGGGHAYNSSLLGSTLSWSGVTFKLGTPDVRNAITSSTIPLAAKSYSTLYMLGTAINGKQAAQTFVVTYTDGTTTTFTQSMSDWSSPQSFAGESVALAMANRVLPNGTLDPHTYNLYGYSFALNPTKTVLSFKLPANSNIVVLAVALLPPAAATATATPVFSPAAGYFTGAQSVTITDATSGSTIYYTTNGTTPTTSSTLYKGPIAVSATTTIKAVATAMCFTDSAIATATFTIGAPPPPTVPTPTFSPAAGAYSTAQSVTIKDTLSATATVKIYYTTNGTAPTTTSTLYKGPIAVSATTTIKALAVATGYTNSAVATATFTINLGPPVTATPVFSPAAGSFTGAQSVSITDATNGSTIYYTTNGNAPTTTSTLYKGPITVSATTTIKALAVASGYTNSAIATAMYTIDNTVTTPVDVTLPSPTVYAIANRGTAVPGGGIDNSNYAYDSSLLGSTLTWSGVTFALGAPEVADAITSTTVPLAANSYSTLYLLGTAVYGSQAAQSFVVTYTDGTTTTFTQSMSDWGTPQSFAGESIASTMADRVQPNGTLDTRTYSLYGYSFALNPAKTVRSLTLPANNQVIILAIALKPASPTADITLPSPTVYAIANRGTAVPGGGIDGSNYAYDSSLLGSTLTWSGVTFALGASEVADAITSSTVPLAANSYSTLYLLGTGVYGNQAAQSFVVTYTDGTTTTFTQSMSDWGTPQSFSGESIALAMADRVQPSGTLDTSTYNLYGYSFALNPAKTVRSLTLPANDHVIILAIALH